MGIPDNVNLGRKGKFGQVNLNGFKGGLKKSDIKSEQMKSVFDKFDINKDGTLSQDEIKELVKSLGGYAQDGKITRREARKFLRQNGLQGEANKKALFGLLGNIEDFTKNIIADQPLQPENLTPENVTPEKVTPETVTPPVVPEAPEPAIENKPTVQDLLAQKLGANGKASALIDGKSTGIGRDYTGQIRLPKGQTIAQGKFPTTLKMSLPASYGANAEMTLTLIDEENGIYESSAHDRRFQVSVDENGNVTVKSVDVEKLQDKLNTNLETYAKAKADEITGAPQEKQVTQGNSLTDENIIYEKDAQGNVKYINKQTGQELTADEAKAFVQAESKAITDKLTKAADYFWGTDIPLMQEGVGNIYSKDILQNVNEQLKAKGFGELKDDGKVVGMPLENLLLDEESHSLVLGHLKTLINNGVMTPQEAARSIKREMEYEVEGGLGITRSAKVETIMNLVPDRETRIELENQFKEDHKDLEENEGSLVRAYLAADGWKPDEVDRFDSYWVQNKVYDESVPEDLEHAKGVVGRLLFEHDTDSDFENQIRAGQALDPESKVYAYVQERAAEENEKAGYKAQFEGQDAVQQFIAGKTADGGKVDSKRVAAFNNGLYKGEKPIDIQAQEVLYDVKSGDFTHVFDSMDPKLYAEIEKMIKGGEVDGIKSMDELYQKALSANSDKMSIQANALLSGTVKMSDEELTSFCVNLMHKIDDERGKGGSTNISASHTNKADYNTVQLKAILQTNPQILASLKEQVENGKFEKKTTIQEMESMAQTYTTDTKADYLKIIADTRYEADEAVFYDNNGKQVTDKRVIKHITENNMKSLDLMREYVAQLERDYKMEVDKQGNLSGMANALSEYSGLGTDRGDVATRYNDAKQLLARMEIAAQGKLRDSDGNVVSLQDLAKEAVDKESELAKTNSDYVSTIQTGKMAIVMAPVIAATMGAGAAAGAAAGAVGIAAGSFAATTASAVGAGLGAGLATYGMNALEYNTSQTGNTASARENNAIESLIAGTTTFVGAEQMPFIGKMLNNASTVLRASGRLTTVLASDIGVGAAGEYVQTGQVTVNGVAMNAVFSATGNLIGLKSLAKKADLPPHVSADGTPHSMDYKGEVNNHRDFVADGEVARNIDQSHLNANEQKMVQDALKDIPTDAEVVAFGKSLKEAPTPEQQAAIEANNAKAAQANAEAHQIGNNLSDDAIAQLEALKNGSEVTPTPAQAVVTPEMKQLQGEITGLQKQIKDLENKINGLKKMGKSTEAYETQLGVKKLRLEEAQGKLEKLQTPDTPATPKADETPEIPVKDMSKAKAGERLPANEAVVVAPDAKLDLAGYRLDLSSPDIKARIDDLKDGESFIVGRAHGIDESYESVSRHHLIITKKDGKIFVKDISTNGTRIADMPAAPKVNETSHGTKLPEINSNELVREAGNGGKKVDAGYIRASQEARAYLNDAIESGNYTESFESYVNTINNMHKVSVGDGWYDKVGQGSNGVEPGVIRNEGIFRNRRIGEAQWVQKVAKKYGDKYNPMAKKSVVKLKGIPDEYKPSCINLDKTENGYIHYYPDGKSMKYYYTEMHRTAKEALNLINSGASEKKILAKLAEHYQYAANARPYSQINNSLFMNEINTLLHKAGLRGMPHGMLDHAAQRLQPDTFQKYFIDEYYRTAV